MPQIVQAGAFSFASANVPDVYTGIVKPQNATIVLAPTDILGHVGTASWGPVNVPVAIGGPSDGTAAFGTLKARKHDVLTSVATAALQGASSHRVVRVTDGTDVAATATVPAADLTQAAAFYAALSWALNAGINVNRGASQLVRLDAATGLLTSAHTGSGANGTVVSISAGSKSGTFRAVVALASLGIRAEVFDNIPAAAGALPTVAAYVLAGGTDGADGVTDATLVGTDVSPRSGMYALRGQACAVAVLVDVTDPVTWTAQAAFGYPEGILMMCVGAAGQDINTACTNKASSGLDDYSVKLFLGDYVYWSDQVNNVVRLVSPLGFAAGKRVTLAPNDSSLNKRLYGIVGSQKSGVVGNGALVQYTQAELEQLSLNGIDVIANPSPGGAYWAVRIGHNTSSDGDVRGESYTSMTNFAAKSINGTMGVYDGQPNTPTLRRRATTSLIGMFSTFVSLGLMSIGEDGSLPYSVVCDDSNNPQSRTGLGYLKADTKARYDGIVEELFVGLEGGPTVVVGANSRSYAAAA